jgi:hypothetical protein
MQWVAIARRGLQITQRDFQSSHGMRQGTFKMNIAPHRITARACRLRTIRCWGCVLLIIFIAACSRDNESAAERTANDQGGRSKTVSPIAPDHDIEYWRGRLAQAGEGMPITVTLHPLLESNDAVEVLAAIYDQSEDDAALRTRVLRATLFFLTPGKGAPPAGLEPFLERASHDTDQNVRFLAELALDVIPKPLEQADVELWTKRFAEFDPTDQGAAEVFIMDLMAEKGRAGEILHAVFDASTDDLVRQHIFGLLLPLSPRMPKDTMRRLLSKGIEDEAANVRGGAVLCYSALDADEALPTVTRMASEDSSPLVRKLALFVAAGIDGDEALDCLRNALNDTDASVRLVAAANLLNTKYAQEAKQVIAAQE